MPRASQLEQHAPSGSSPTPVSVVPEPAPTRQERVVAPPPPLEALSAAVAPARGAGSWSPAELLAQVIAEIQAEERGAGLPQGTSWEPVPLDATQPISTDEVAARLAAEGPGPATVTVAAADDQDLPAMRHEAGRAGMRMALLTAAGLIMGILGGWTAMKLLSKPPRPRRSASPRCGPRSRPRRGDALRLACATMHVSGTRRDLSSRPLATGRGAGRGPPERWRARCPSDKACEG
jgi:hypothetical protein